MIIDCISDLHGFYPELGTGDILIVAGDLTAKDGYEEWEDFFLWFRKQKYRKKILIGGNHDNRLLKMHKDEENLPEIICDHMHFHDSSYLCDSGTEFEGLKIWGSPYTSYFEGINPNCMAFTENYGCDTDEWLGEHWRLIPHNTDILITHGPPYGILDKNKKGIHCGSISLRNRCLSEYRKLHVFGHIHEYGGRMIDTLGCKFVNASIMNEKYQPLNKPIRIEL